MIGPFLNSGAIVLGGIFGYLLHKYVPKRIAEGLLLAFINFILKFPIIYQKIKNYHLLVQSLKWNYIYLLIYNLNP